MSNIPEELALVFAPGTIVAGRYRVERVLGQGGMGLVVAARHLDLERTVALKFLLTRGSERPALLTRFSREGRAAARLEGEHVARVLDSGDLPSGGRFLAMEYLEGRDLRALIAEDAPLAVERAVELVLEACEAVAEAHALGIIHRDLKPANLFLARSRGGGESVKVLDFGISKLLDDPSGDGDITESGEVFGSPRYMSPEQLRSARDVTGRTDAWALGCVLFELCVGHPPFDAATRADVVAAILREPAPSARALRADVPVELDAAIAAALCKEPNQRPTIAELARRIAPHGTTRAAQSLERIEALGAAADDHAAVTTPPAGYVAPSTDTFAGTGATLPPPRRVRALLPWLAAGLALGAAAWLAWPRAAGPTPPAAAAPTPLARALPSPPPVALAPSAAPSRAAAPSLAIRAVPRRAAKPGSHEPTGAPRARVVAQHGCPDPLCARK
ncbi:MAG: protein kinase [Sorangiineae bacterium]|nr:protein kinase [Polyangiaceae bacterium]MEB2323515.1 protein kinase [Sorangiineae bacterium]